MLKKNKQKFTRKKRNIGHLWIEIIFIFLLIMSSIVDFFINIDIPSEILSSNIILFLFPTIITIISIILSLSNETIHGISRLRFNKLRGGYIYSFTWMIILLIISFSAYGIFSFFSFSISIICLEIITLFYSFFFSIQEIPVLIHNNKYINKILQNAYYDVEKEKKIKEEYEDKHIIISDVLRKMVFSKKYGLKLTYLSIKKRNINAPALLDQLLSFENEYLSSEVDNISFLKNNIDGYFKEINVYESIENSYDNILDLLKFSDDFNIRTIYKDGNTPVYKLQKTIFLLHKIVVGLSLENIQKKEVSVLLLYILNNIMKKNNPQESYSFLNAMMILSLKEGEIWFAELFREKEIFLDSLFNISFFYFIYCFYLTKIDSTKNNKAKDNISLLINTPQKGVFEKSRIWIQEIENFLEFGAEKNILDLINQLLDIYNYSDDSIYFNNCIYDLNVFYLNDDTKFTKNIIIDIWLEIILYNPFFYVDNNSFFEFLNSLNDDNKKNIVQRFSNKWIENVETNSIKKVVPNGFLNFVGVLNEDCGEINNENVKNTLFNFRSNFLQNQISSEINEVILNEDKCNNYKSKLIKGFKKAIDDYPLSKKDVDSLCLKEVRFSIFLDNNKSIKTQIEHLVKSMTSLIGNVVRNEIIIQVEPNVDCEPNFINKKIIDMVLNFKPNFMSANSSIKYYATEEEVTRINEITPVKDAYLPTNLFWREGGIITHLKFIPSGNELRKLSRNEIDEKIDKDYKMINGLYKYEYLTSIGSQSYLVTREELINNLSNTLFLSEIVLEYRVECDKEKIFFVNKKTNH